MYGVRVLLHTVSIALWDIVGLAVDAPMRFSTNEYLTFPPRFTQGNLWRLAVDCRTSAIRVDGRGRFVASVLFLRYKFTLSNGARQAPQNPLRYCRCSLRPSFDALDKWHAGMREIRPLAPRGREKNPVAAVNNVGPSVIIFSLVICAGSTSAGVFVGQLQPPPTFQASFRNKLLASRYMCVRGRFGVYTMHITRKKIASPTSTVSNPSSSLSKHTCLSCRRDTRTQAIQNTRDRPVAQQTDQRCWRHNGNTA